jgi:calcium-dependent protein kinase
VVAYLLLCGYPPFNGNNDSEIYASIARGDLDFPADIGWTNKSPASIDFIKGLLQRDPRRRLTAQEALMHPWIVQMTSTTTPEAAFIQQESFDERRQVPSFGPPYFSSIPLFAPPFPPSDIFTMA